MYRNSTGFCVSICSMISLKMNRILEFNNGWVMNKVILKFIFVFSLILPNLIQSTFLDNVDYAYYASCAGCFIKNNPIKSIVGACLIINACKNGKKSIVFVSLKSVLTVVKILPKLFSNKVLLSTAAIVGGAYVYKNFNKNMIIS